MKPGFSVLFIVLFSAISVSQASALVFSETDDAGGIDNPFAIGAFSLGANTVSGSLATTCIANPDDTFADCTAGVGDFVDLYSFSVPDNLFISAVSLEISNLSISGTLQDDRLAAVSAGGQFIPFAELTSGNAIDLNLDLLFFAPFLTDRLGIGIASATRLQPDFLQGIGEFSFDYTFDVAVAEIPVPGALPLMLSGLIGIGLFRKTRKKMPRRTPGMP